jgi:hypothetical protein
MIWASLVHFVPVPQYCERLGSGLLAEPLNVFSNLFFIAASVILLQHVRANSTAHPKWLRFLIIMVGAIGVGSTVFHMEPNHLTVLFDTVPIYTFLVATLLLLVYKMTRSWEQTLYFVGFYGLLQIAVTIVVPQSFLNGSIRHLITAVTASGLLAVSIQRYGRRSWWLLATIVVYGLAILMRSIDPAACANFRLGTHFIWHILAATTCFLAVVYVASIDKQR